MIKNEITYDHNTAKSYKTEDTARKKAKAVLDRVEANAVQNGEQRKGGVRFSVVRNKEERWVILFFPSEEWLQDMIWAGAYEGHKIISM